VFSPCTGDGDTGIVVKLYDELDIFTGIQATTQDSGFFIIDGQILSTLNSSLDYYISVSGLGGTEISDTKSLFNLAMDSYHILDCIEPLEKRSPVNSKKVNEKYDIAIYPNPSSKGFMFTGMPASWKMEISDIVGKTILEKYGSGNTDIPVGVFPKGVYSVIIINLQTNEQISKKLLSQ
jgi:hypothetical protein